MHIRPMRLEDIPAVQALLEENKLTVDGVDYSHWTPPCLVAVRDGQIVGMIQAHLGLPYSVVTECAVARAYQRRGYGVRLWQALELLTQQAGSPALAVQTAREDIQAMLERLGATPGGQTTAYLKRLT